MISSKFINFCGIDITTVVDFKPPHAVTKHSIGKRGTRLAPCWLTTALRGYRPIGTGHSEFSRKFSNPNSYVASSAFKMVATNSVVNAVQASAKTEPAGE